MNAYAGLSDYELAMLFRSVATERCRSHAEDDERQAELGRIGAAMDARDVRLEDWAGLR